jgi:NAD+ kinase
MRIGIAKMQTTELAAKSIKETLSDAGIDSFYFKNNSQITMADLVIVLGGDRGVRNYFHHTLDIDTPVLGVSESESSGFLSQIELRDLRLYLSRLKKQDYVIESVPRIAVKIDGKNTHPVLNDVAVFTSKSATLMEHVLRVNDEEVWHDNSDGVIISTPIGSSAYSMSAGGPVIFQAANVFGIISVNSLDTTRRPLIVSDNSIIEIDEISSRLHCDVVLDGIDRYKVIEKIELTKFTPPARIIRMNADSTAVSALAKKVKLAEELLAMPPSSKLLLKILEYEGSMTQKELISKTLLPSRTVRLALKHLMENGHIRRKISMRDARQKIYEISN